MPKISISNDYKRDLVMLLGEKPEINYHQIAEASGKSYSTIARWMMNPTEEQYVIMKHAVEKIRGGENV